MTDAEEWLDNMDPEVVQFDNDVQSVCPVCFVEDYQHDEDCELGGRSAFDEEIEYLGEF